MLRHYRAAWLQRKLAAGPAWDDLDLVFCRDDGHWWHPDHVTETLRELVEDAGLPRIRPLQDLRHTHATLLLADGEPTKVVQERLGHHSSAFTIDTYQAFIPGMGAQAARRFEGLVFGRSGPASEAPGEPM